MGTTADKGEYLNTTKSLLKDKINNLGGEITDETTFREYTNQLQEVYDRLPKTEYQEGSSITLENTLKGKLDFEDGIVGIGDTKQDTRQGYNISNFNTDSQNGISYNTNTINIINPTSFNYADNWNLKNDTSLSGSTYTIYICVNGTKASGVTIELNIGKTGNGYAFQKLLSSNTTNFNNDISVGTITLGDNEVFTSFNTYLSQSVTANLEVKVMVVKGSYTISTIPSYEEYGASPSPTYPSEVKVVKGKNRLDDSNLVLFNSNKYVSTTNYTTQGKIAVNPSTTYSLIYISGTGTITDNGLYEFDKDNNKTTITTTNTYTGSYLVKVFKTLSTTKTMSFYAGSSDTYNTISEFLEDKKLMLLEGDYSSQVIPSYLPYNTIGVKARGLNSFDYSVIDNNHISMGNPNNATISFNDNGFTITPTTQGDNYTISGMDITNATIRSDLRKYLIEVKPNTAYTFIMDLNYSVLGGLSAHYSLIDSNYKVTAFRTSTQNSKAIDSNNRRYFANITTSADTKYLGFRYGNQGTAPVTYSNIMLVKGTYNVDTLPTYEPYYTPQIKQLSLGDKELAKIRTYVDTFEYDIDNDKVYKNKNILKISINNATNVNYQTSLDNNSRFAYYTSPSLDIINATSKGFAYCNRLSLENGFTLDTAHFYTWSTVVYFFLPNNIANSLETFATWVANNNLEFYIPLNNAVKEEITGTLKEQIKEIYNLMSYTGTTILEVDGNLPSIIKVRALNGE